MRHGFFHELHTISWRLHDRTLSAEDIPRGKARFFAVLGVDYTWFVVSMQVRGHAGRLNAGNVAGNAVYHRLEGGDSVEPLHGNVQYEPT